VRVRSGPCRVRVVEFSYNITSQVNDKSVTFSDIFNPKYFTLISETPRKFRSYSFTGREISFHWSVIGNESVPKIIINNTIIFFSLKLKLQSSFWLFQTITVSECCLIKLLPYILLEKHLHILDLKMASPGNRHCANCIGTLSFPISMC